MQQGEEFKAFEELFQPDGSSLAFSVLDPTSPDGVRAPTLRDDYDEVAQLALIREVPDQIRGYFDAARILWVFGHVYYPFYTWAGFHAHIAGEMGLRARYATEVGDASSRPVPLKRLIDTAIAREWLSPEQFARVKANLENRAKSQSIMDQILGRPPLTSEQEAEALRQMLSVRLTAFNQLRNSHAHAAGLWYMPSGSGFAALEFTRDILNQLFSPPTHG